MGGRGSGRKGGGLGGIMKTSAAPYVRAANRPNIPKKSAYEKQFSAFKAKHGAKKKYSPLTDPKFN